MWKVYIIGLLSSVTNLYYYKPVSISIDMDLPRSWILVCVYWFLKDRVDCVYEIKYWCSISRFAGFLLANLDEYEYFVYLNIQNTNVVLFLLGTEMPT